MRRLLYDLCSNAVAPFSDSMVDTTPRIALALPG
jgi:hypothetical protein